VQISRKNLYWNARGACPVYVWRVCLFPNTCHVRVDTHCPRHTLLGVEELNHVGGRSPFSPPPPSSPSLSHSVAVPPPRNYKVIGDICESSFNPFAPSMNMQKRRQNEPTMFRCARRRSKRRGIRSADAPSLRASSGSMFPDLLNERRIARRSRGDRQSTRRGLSLPASKCLLR